MLAIIGGTGFGNWPGMEVLSRGGQETPLGAAACGVVKGRINGQTFLFLARHGQPHKVPPHRINYRANLWALKQAGATHVVGVNCVSGIDPALMPGALVVPDQLIDYTTGRDGTFFDGRFKPFRHVEFAWPYHRAWRVELQAAGADAGVCVVEGGVMGVVQGPRLETAAEIRLLARDGNTLVGMTGMPEAILARELEMEYASLCLVIGHAAGIGEEERTREGTELVIESGMQRAQALLEALLDRHVAGLRVSPPEA